MPSPKPVHLRSAILRLIIPIGGALYVGCEATSPGGPASVSLSVATAPGGSANVGAGPNSVKITKVEFVLAGTELARAATCSPEPAGNTGCHALLAASLQVDLPLGAAPPRRVLEAPVSAGTYMGLQARLLSLRAVGVYTDASGTPHDFTFSSTSDARLQLAFARPVTISGARNVTLAANVARWFANGQGTVIDPRSSANAAAINANIGGSFQAFQDDDEDAVEDDPNEVDDDPTEVEDDPTEVEDDTTEVEDDTTETRAAAEVAFLSLFRTSATR